MTVPVPPEPDVVPEDLPESDDEPQQPPAIDEPHLDPSLMPPRIR